MSTYNIFISRRSDSFFIDDRSLGDIGNYDFVNGPEASLALSAKLGGGCNTTLPISPDHIRQVKKTRLNTLIRKMFIFLDK